MTLKAYAKLNLYLAITGALPNGYHTLEMIMQSVDLFDTLEISLDDSISVQCDGIDEQNNLAYKAARLFFDESGINGGAKIRIQKRIPMMAGLGGGSADAAAVLYGLNKLYDGVFDDLKLADIGKKLGADVPFSLTGGCCIARGLGEQLTPIKNSLNCAYLICKPVEGCSTPSVYNQFDISPNYPESGRFDNAVSSIENGDISSFMESCYNSLTPAASVLCPRVPVLLNDISRTDGCIGSFMTGSGSACVGIFEDISSAQYATKELSSKSSDLKAFAVNAVKSGVSIE